MLGDDNGPAAQAGSGYGPLPPISSAPGIVAHHEDVGAMTAHGPRQIIDRSRQLDPPHDWSDELPTWEWMQRRNSARPISR